MGSSVGEYWWGAACRMATQSLFDLAVTRTVAHTHSGDAGRCEEYAKRIKVVQAGTLMLVRLKGLVRQTTTSGLKWTLLLMVSSVVTMPPAFAQNAVEPWVEYHKHLEAAERIAALEGGFSGDSVSLYDGATSFSVTDISVPGNSALPVQLVRRLAIELRVQGINAYDTRLLGAGNWDVDVPYMTATYPSPSAYTGSPGWQAQRCSGSSWWLGMSLPPPFWDSDVWSGTTIHIPGRGNTKALALNASVPVPTSGGPYYRTTSARDVLDCIPMQSGLSGEGFRLTTISGVHYYFDVGLTRVASTIKKWWSDGGQARYLPRDQYYLLASKIQDRYGNWVQFQYSGAGHPTRIWSSDGREIDLTYSGDQLESATSGGRTWHYDYDSSGNLIGVTLPDTSGWQYTYSGSLTPPMPPPGENFINDYCDFPPALIDDTYTLTAKSPSGASASFHFQNTRHGRSGVIVNECINIGQPLSPVWYLRTANFFDVMSLTQKTISGPGIPTATWTYSYGGVASRLWGKVDGYNPYPCTTCQLDKINTVSEPDGTKRQYRFGVEYALNDGRELETDIVLADGSVIRGQVDDYLAESDVSGQPFYPEYGDILAGVGDPATAYIRPVVQSQISQDGATFTTATSTFDSFARPLEQTESSSLGYSRVDEIAYYDNATMWVLGQVAERKVNGITRSSTTYDAATALPLTYSAFGKLKQTLTWRTDGTLASVKDGNNYITTVSNWRRGIPQAIGHPDGTSESAGVNDSGWITWAKDENGFTTSYDYDPMGRLASITYPTDDDVAWNQTLLSFAPVAGSEYGIPAGHWKQTIHTGNGYTVTYFDAFWRPLVTEHYDAGNKAATLSQVATRYDVMGRKVFASYPASNVSNYATYNTGTHTSYDALDRVTQVVQDSELGGLPTTTQYQTGFKTKVTNPREFSTTTSYQAFGEPDTSRPVSISMPEGVTTTITRDPFGKPLSVKRSGSYGGSAVSATRTFVYDSNQLLCKRIEPETGATLFSYDGASNLAWSAPGTSLNGNTCDRGSVSSNQKITRGYDPRNRLTSIAYPDGVSNAEYTYALDGAMLSAINHNGSSAVQTVYGYDKRRLLTAEALSVPGASTFAVGYGYDANGHLGSLVYPDGRILTFVPNALGQPTQAGSYATGVSYFPNGAIKQFAYGDGSVHTLTQNPRGLPERSRDSNGATAVLDNTADYDGNGNVAAITDGLPGSVGNIDMGYDGMDRLTVATSPMFAGNHQAGFTYDPLDNLRNAGVGNGNQYIYSYDLATNRLASMVGTQTFDFGYDARGNVAYSNSQAYTFDMADRLRAANGLENYLYDAAGRRARKSNLLEGTLTYYFYDKSGLLLYQWDQGTALKNDYVYLGGSLIAKITKAPPPPPPATPASISVPATSYSASIPVNWSASTGATGYVLEQSANGGAWSEVYNGTATSTTVTVSATGSYTYRVKACNADGCSDYRTSGAVAVTLKPVSAPSLSGPSASSSGAFTVSWSAVSGASKYQLNQSINGGAWAAVYNGTSRSWSSSSLGNGTYAYKAYGWNEAGFGPASNQVTVTVTHPPGAPASISVPTSSYSASIAVSWSASATATSYVLEQSVNGGSWSQAYSGAATSMAVTVPATGSYTYRVKACNAGGCSGYRTSGAVAVTLKPASAPSLSGSSSSVSGTFTLSWTAVSGTTRYQLNQSKDGGADSAVYNSTGRSWSSSGLSNGSYAYHVYACNTAGCSARSNGVTVTVLHVPAAPASVNAPAQVTLGEAFSVNWSASSTASRYELQQRQIGEAITTVYNGPNTSAVVTINGPIDVLLFKYSARACNASGCSDWTAALNTTTVKMPGGGGPGGPSPVPMSMPASGSSAQ